jgi:hypothetical protein
MMMNEVIELATAQSYAHVVRVTGAMDGMAEDANRALRGIHGVAALAIEALDTELTPVRALALRQALELIKSTAGAAQAEVDGWRNAGMAG